MAPFTGQIRTSQERENFPAFPADSTYRWQRQYVEYFKEPAWGALILSDLGQSLLITVGWVM